MAAASKRAAAKTAASKTATECGVERDVELGERRLQVER